LDVEAGAVLSGSRTRGGPVIFFFFFFFLITVLTEQAPHEAGARARDSKASTKTARDKRPEVTPRSTKQAPGQDRDQDRDEKQGANRARGQRPQGFRTGPPGGHRGLSLNSHTYKQRGKTDSSKNKTP
jgi:hypothetical protein